MTNQEFLPHEGPDRLAMSIDRSPENVLLQLCRVIVGSLPFTQKASWDDANARVKRLNTSLDNDQL